MAGEKRQRIAARVAWTLFFVGIWTIGVPYLDRALGFGVAVPAWIEVVDHVVPGAVVATLAFWLIRQSGSRGEMRPWRPLVAVGGCILAGAWVFANHLTLLADATRGQVQWGAALWHSSSSLAIVGLAVGYLFVIAEPSPASES